MKNVATIRDWCDSIVSLCINSADRGQEVTGYKFVESFGRRRWKDEAAVEAKYKDEFGERIFKKKLHSPAQLEKVLGKDRKSELAELVETPVTGKSLVPIDDARPAVASGAAADFS